MSVVKISEPKKRKSKKKASRSRSKSNVNRPQLVKSKSMRYLLRRPRLGRTRSKTHSARSDREDKKQQRKLKEIDSMEDNSPTSATEKPPPLSAIDRLAIDERRRWLIKVRMISRNECRKHFGIKFLQCRRSTLDGIISHKIHKFSNWLDYAPGNHVLKAHAPMSSAVISTDGRYLYTGRENRTIIKWDLLNNGERIKKWTAHDRGVYCLTYHHSGLVISGSMDSTIRLWNGLDQEKLVYTLQGHTKGVRTLHNVNHRNDQLGSSSLLVSGSFDKTIRVWNVKKGTCLKVLTGHSKLVRSVRFISSLEVISGSDDGSLRVWKSNDDGSDDGGESRIIADGITDIIHGISVNSDGSMIAYMFGNGFTVFRWPSLEVICSVEARAFGGCFHPSRPNLLFVSGSSPHHCIYVYDANTGEVIRSFKGHTSWVNDLTVTGDGCRLVSVSEDKTTRFWDLSQI